jgi:hypothetical protein
LSAIDKETDFLQVSGEALHEEMNLGVGCENERFEQFKSELSGGNGEGKL